MRTSDELAGSSAGGRPVSSVGGQTARDRNRLRVSEAAVADRVIEFQLARQRIGLITDEATVPLTPRETEVAALVAAGSTDGEIADRLVITKKTASVHVANIKSKLGASSRVEIALIATRLGLVDAASTGADHDASGAARHVATCPFKGLASFEPADAPYFFGRERMVAECVAKLAGSTFLGVVGPSGSGKSSLVRAGLVPAISAGVLPGSERWSIAVMRPGETPTTVLETTLGRVVGAGEQERDRYRIEKLLDALPGDARLLLVVDQFEETFSSCADETQRQQFIRSLIELATDTRARALLVLAVRADFYGRCADYRDLAEMLAASGVLVGPMTADELTRAIELPARATGLRVERDLVSSLVSDVLDQPGGLPLLSTTLLDLWQRRDGRTLKRETYERLGGVSGAVARFAEAAFAKLTAPQQDIARAVFLRLAAVTEAGTPVKRRVKLRELDVEADSDVARVLAVFTEGRLLTLDDGFLEVAHEALLREWPRMHRWFVDDADGRRIREHLTQTAREWKARGFDATDLYRGARLTTALEWSERHPTELNDLEARFLRDGLAASEREIRSQRRINRRLRGLLATTAMLLIVATAAGLLAWQQSRVALERATIAAEREVEANAARQQADEARRRAEAAANFARSRELSASSSAALTVDPTLGKLLAVAAAETRPPDIEVESALHAAWLADATVARYAIAADAGLDGVAADLHPGGSLMVATAGQFSHQAHGLEVADVAANRLMWRYQAPSEVAIVKGGLFSIDGSSVIAGLAWNRADGAVDDLPPSEALGVLVFDTSTGRLKRRFDVGPCGGQVLSISVDRVLVATVPTTDGSTRSCVAGADASVLLTVALATGATSPLTTSGGTGALSRDGRLAVFDDPAHATVSVVDLATGARLARVDSGRIVQRDHSVRAVSADGSIVLYGDRPIVALNTKTGTVIARLGVGEADHYGAAFSGATPTAYTTARSGALTLWDVPSGVRLFDQPGAGSAGQVSASADGRVLMSNSATNTVTLFDLEKGGEVGGVATCPGFMPAASLQVAAGVATFSPGCADDQFTTYVVDIANMHVMTKIPDFEGQTEALSPDGRLVVRQSTIHGVSQPISVFDARSGRVTKELRGQCTWDFSEVATEKKSAPCKSFPEQPFGLWPGLLVWSPDGSYIAAVDGDLGNLAVWDAASGEVVKAERRARGTFHGAIFTPGADQLIVSRYDGVLISYSTADWRVIRQVTLDPAAGDVGRLGLAGFLSDQHTLVGVGGDRGVGGGWLLRIDVPTLRVVGSNRAHDGAPKSFAMSPDGKLVATGAADGHVRVWDGVTGTLLHEFAVTGQAQGVAFFGNDRVAVTPQAGGLLVMSINRAELVEAVAKSLTRGFTPEECARYSFGDQCPTLQQLQAAASR